MRLLSYISQYLRKQENIDKLLSSNEKENVRNSIIRHTKMPNEIEASDSHKLVTAIVQDEDKFSDILNCITEIEDSNISILESSNAGHYLYHMPLFTSFMQTDRNDFCRIIIVSINKNRLKEMIGNLEYIIQGEDGVMYFVQNIEYFSGKLEI